MKKQILYRARKILSVIFLCILFYYIYRYFSFQWENFVTYNWEFNYLYVLIAFILGALAIVMNASNWRFILKKTIKHELPLIDAIRIFSLSLLGRYIPGKVWMFAGKIYLLSKRNITMTKAGTSVIIEFFFFNITSVYIFIFFHILTLEITSLLKYSFLSIVLLTIFVVPASLNILDKKIARLFNRNPILTNSNYCDLLIAQSRYFISWSLQGLGLFFLIKSIYPIGLKSFPIVTAYFSLSCTAGVMALIAPAGLGVREYVMALFFQNLLPQEVIMMTITLSRLWLTSLEFLISIASQSAFSMLKPKSMR